MAFKIRLEIFLGRASDILNYFSVHIQSSKSKILIASRVTLKILLDTFQALLAILQVFLMTFRNTLRAFKAFLSTLKVFPMTFKVQKVIRRTLIIKEK